KVATWVSTTAIARLTSSENSTGNLHVSRPFRRAGTLRLRGYRKVRNGSVAFCTRHRSCGCFFCNQLREVQHLPGLDLVGIGQLVSIQFEDLHVGAGAAQMLLGN